MKGPKLDSRDIADLLGSQIRQIRKSAGLTQVKLAERARLHPVYVGAVERGEKNVTIGSILRIARALDVTIYALFGKGTLRS